MRWHNVIGQKEIELYPGKAGPVMPPGATIPLNHDVTDASIDTFLNSLGPVLASINPTEANAFVENVSGALEGDTAQINQLHQQRCRGVEHRAGPRLSGRLHHRQPRPGPYRARLALG